MRIRAIKPEFWTDSLTGEFDARRALFFVGTWQVADDAGRLRLDPRLIRAELDPFDTKFGGVAGVAELLEELVRLGRVLPYEVGGQRFGLVAHFVDHQVINKPTKSRLPDPPEGLRERYRNAPVAFPPKVGVEGKGREGSMEGNGEGEQGLGPPSALPGGQASGDRLSTLTVALVAAYQELRGEKYRHSGAKDAQALKRLLADAEPAEIERRWRLALVASGFHRCDSFAQLAMQEKWAHFGSSTPGLVTAPAAPAADFVPGPVNL